MPVQFFNLDIEVTNRCNAHCYFCPRDQTPHQGLMSVEVFDQSLARAVEFAKIAEERFGTHVKVNLCGLGEPLLNRHVPDFVRKVRAAGFECSLSTNGSLLDLRHAEALLEAGLQGAEINVGEVDEDYEKIYGLPFEKTCENVVRFNEMAGDQCQVRIVLVNHRRDAKHMAKMTQFWTDKGIRHFMPFEIMNRGGALFVDEMQYAEYPERAEALSLFREREVQPVCPVPFTLLFIGYDGNYYLCCSDWKKEVPLGSVFDATVAAVTEAKLAHVSTGEPICKNCNHDPINQLTDILRTASETGERYPKVIARQIDGLVEGDVAARGIADELVSNEVQFHVAPPRRLIPVTAVEAPGADH
jgi:MoaA/NifB/PqqE/SkfB family radical SAM enzyme